MLFSFRLGRTQLKTQACPWEWDSYGNPMGNVPWDAMGQA